MNVINCFNDRSATYSLTQMKLELAELFKNNL